MPNDNCYTSCSLAVIHMCHRFEGRLSGDPQQHAPMETMAGETECWASNMYGLHQRLETPALKLLNCFDPSFKHYLEGSIC